jgi:hypothetical protein
MTSKSTGLLKRVETEHLNYELNIYAPSLTT